MKTAHVLSCFVCFACVASGHAQTRSSVQTAASLEQALREGSSGAKNQLSTPEWTNQFTQLRAAALRLDTNAATPIVRQIEAQDLPDAARALCRELLDEIRQERKARNEAFTQRVNAAIKKAREACRHAKTESDLDPTQRELSAFVGELKREPNAPKIEGLATRLRWTGEAVSAWQDGLALRAKGYDKEADKRRQEATGFVEDEDDFDGPRHVVATMNPDGSGDVTWENVPGDDEDIDLRFKDRSGQWVTLAVVPAGSTSYHIPSNQDAPPKKHVIRPHGPPVTPSDPAQPGASGAAAGNTPADSGRKPVD